jgi:hypothetical protein
MIEALAQAGIPTIPVRLYQEEGKWKKRPLAETWDDATTDCDVLEEWSRRWPDAKPGIPLERVGWVAIDLDDYADADFRAAWVKPEKVVTRKGRSFVEPEHYSIYKTPSGGRHIVFAQPDPPLAGRMQWSPGVEVLGSGCLLTVYDWNAVLYPRVAQRAVLPEVFRQPYAPWEGESLPGGFNAYPRKKPTLRDEEETGERVEVAGAVEALRQMNPADWRGKSMGGTCGYEKWFVFVSAVKSTGTTREDFIEWSTQDPRYAAHRKSIGRIWDSASGRHGGVFFKALSERGIKLSPDTSAKHGLFPEVRDKPAIPPAHRPQASHWLARVKGLRARLRRDQCEASLFSYACLYAEILYEEGKASADALATAQTLLEEDCPKLIREIGIDGVRRSIRRAFERIKEQQS